MHGRLLLSLLLGTIAPSEAQTTRLVAPGGTDAGDCTTSPCATIRYAVGQASPGDLVSVAAGTYTEVNVVVDRNVAIHGGGRDRTIVQAAAAPWTASGRVFTIAEGVTAVIEALTIRHGHDLQEATGGGLKNLGDVTLRRVAVLDNVAPEAGSTSHAPRGGGLYNRGTMRLDRVLVRRNVAERFDPPTGSSVGGGLYNHGVSGTEALYVTDSVVDDNFAEVSGGIEHIDDDCFCPGPVLHVERSTISRNRAVRAGGLRNAGGEATVVNSTVSGNEATGVWGGGIENAWGALLLSHSTVTNNAAFQNGGGIYGTFTLKNTLIAGNTAPQGPDCYTSAAQSLDYNLLGDPSGCVLEGETTHTLFGVDPLLGPLAANGGPTPTHALLSGSPAIDAGTCEGEGGAPIHVDQRGVSRRGAARSEPCDIGAYDHGAGVGAAAALVGASAQAPEPFTLSAPSPNPFVASAGLTLSASEAQRVRVVLYDVLGRQVAVLFEGDLSAGVVYPIEVDGSGLPGGVYVVAVEGEHFRARQRVTRAR